MNYSIIKTDTANVVFGKDDPRNYVSVSNRILAGGDSLEEAKTEAMRDALRTAEMFLSDRPAAISLIWRTGVQLDLQVSWDDANAEVSRETYVICRQPNEGAQR